MSIFTRRAFIAAATAVAMTAGLPVAAADDSWPSRTIRFLVPSVAGGGADTVARLLSQHIGEELGQTIIVENRAGGSGVVGGNALLNAPTDGYTLMLGFTTMTQFPATSPTPMPYQVDEDFIPISLVATSTNVLMVNKNNMDVHSVDELVETLRAEPDSHSYGSYGTGSTGHFMGTHFTQSTETEAQHVPYQGAAPMMTDLLAGVTDFAFPDIGSALPHLESERVRILAVTGENRMGTLPDTPTMQELGYDGFLMGGWFGLFAAKGTPDNIIQIMSEQVQKAVADPEVQTRLTEMNLVPVGSDTETFAKFFQDDLQLWVDLAEKADIRTNAN